MADRIKSMEVICSVAALGSVSAAARALRLSPTMVAKHIDAMEYAMGKRLFVRSTKGTELTEAGRKYASLSEALLIQYSGICNSMQDDPDDIAGEIVLHSTYDLLDTLLNASLLRFSSNYPEVRFSIMTERRDPGPLERNEVAIGYGMFEHESSQSEVLRRTRGSVVCSPAYLMAHEAPLTVEDLKRHQCLVLMSPRFADGSWWKFGRHGEFPVHVAGRIASDDMRLLLRAALSGAGIFWCARDVVSPYLETGELLELILDKPPVENLPISAHFRAHASPTITRLVESLKVDLSGAAVEKIQARNMNSMSLRKTMSVHRIAS